MTSIPTMIVITILLKFSRLRFAMTLFLLILHTAYSPSQLTIAVFITPRYIS